MRKQSKLVSLVHDKTGDRVWYLLKKKEKGLDTSKGICQVVDAFFDVTFLQCLPVSHFPNTFSKRFYLIIYFFLNQWS